MQEVIKHLSNAYVTVRVKPHSSGLKRRTSNCGLMYLLACLPAMMVTLVRIPFDATTNSYVGAVTRVGVRFKGGECDGIYKTTVLSLEYAFRQRPLIILKLMTEIYTV